MRTWLLLPICVLFIIFIAIIAFSLFEMSLMLHINKTCIYNHNNNEHHHHVEDVNWNILFSSRILNNIVPSNVFLSFIMRNIMSSMANANVEFSTIQVWSKTTTTKKNICKVFITIFEHRVKMCIHIFGCERVVLPLQYGNWAYVFAKIIFIDLIIWLSATPQIS